MKKKIISIVVAICLVVATVPTIVFASNSQSTSPIKIRVAPSEHEKPGWNVEWSESFKTYFFFYFPPLVAVTVFVNILPC